jgi:hypothetical protein
VERRYSSVRAYGIFVEETAAFHPILGRASAFGWISYALRVSTSLLRECVHFPDSSTRHLRRDGAHQMILVRLALSRSIHQCAYQL